MSRSYDEHLESQERQRQRAQMAVDRILQIELRDHFAAAIAAGLIANAQVSPIDLKDDEQRRTIADAAYLLASEMMERRREHP